MSLEQKRLELLEQLAQVEQAIEAEKPEAVFAHGETYHQPTLLQSKDLILIEDFFTNDTEISTNPTGLFMFKTKERCEAFNKKLLELAERQAILEYGEVKKPEDFHLAREYFDIDKIQNKPDKIKQLRDYCNQCLDYLEQKESRA